MKSIDRPCYNLKPAMGLGSECQVFEVFVKRDTETSLPAVGRFSMTEAKFSLTASHRVWKRASSS